MENNYKILLADDEPDILEILSINLIKEGFTVDTVNNGEEVLEYVKNEKPDLIVLDLMMPLMDGFEACKKLKLNKTTSQIPIIFLTARTDDFVELQGFDVGAEDFIGKPVNPKILTSRVKVILKRLQNTSKNSFDLTETLVFENLVINNTNFSVLFNSNDLKLPRKEFELLRFLASQPGRVFRREEILGQVWGSDVVVVDRTIDVHIRKLREKLNDKFIETVKGVGYRFVA